MTTQPGITNQNNMSFLTSGTTWTAFAAVTGAIAAAAAIVALFLTNRESDAKELELERFKKQAAVDIANAQARAAKLEKEAADAQLELSRLTTPRTEKFNRDAFKAALKGMPIHANRVELLFAANDGDSYFFAVALKVCLAAEGWPVLDPRPMEESDIPPRKIYSGAPLFVRAGVGTGGIGFAAGKYDSDDKADPIVILMDAINAGRASIGDKGGLLSTAAIVPAIPAGTVKIVIGPKYHKW